MEQFLMIWVCKIERTYFQEAFVNALVASIGAESVSSISGRRHFRIARRRMLNGCVAVILDGVPW